MSSTIKSMDDGSMVFLDLLKKQIGRNLQGYSGGKDCPMTKKEIFELSQFQHEHEFEENIHAYGISVGELFHNSPPAVLYERALAREPGTFISSSGALMVSSGAKTGRCPGDKRVVEEPSSVDDIWWGKINMMLSESSYLVNRERAIDYINLQPELYIVDAYAGWDPEYRIKIRVISTRAYHALFMQNMLVEPTAEELAHFKPEFIIYNAGSFPANRYTDGVTSQTSVAIHFGRGEMVILGTQYAGEMKKGIFTLMMYLMPKKGQLPLHSSANIGPEGDVTVFFGLSGTGKTTLSADPKRDLMGDDEHVWTDTGIFNIEGGCYAKCKDLSREAEPEIFDAIRFGTVLENVRFQSENRTPDYEDTTITENTRAAYPLKFIPNARIPAVVPTHPSNIILLTCDAFGVLPPLSKLTPRQVAYHFIAGYTSKMTGTEVGVTEPTATFSACFAAPFLAWHPVVYADMLMKKLEKHTVDAWLINTGWVGGSASGTGKRCPLKYTRQLVDAIHDGSAAKAEFEEMPVFRLAVPKAIGTVPSEILIPSRAWKNQEEYQVAVKKLGETFNSTFRQYISKCPPDIVDGGPEV